ncbi:MAG: hypothetical protein ACI3XQ_01570 [Eubacteriales bacterium]
MEIIMNTGKPILLYFNDYGHALSQKSPYNPDGQSTPTEYINRSAVDEAILAGADIFLEEVYGWLPLYPSRVYSAKEHLDWFVNEYGGKAEGWGLPILEYTMAGGDFVKTQLDRTHELGKKFFVSFRLNDQHFLGDINKPEKMRIWNICRKYYENPEWRINEIHKNSWRSYSKFVWDFGFEGAREYKLSMIAELIENYDIDGFLIDFMRYPFLFNQERTPNEADRIEIMTNFVAKVYGMLEKKAKKTGKAYTLGVKIPQTDTYYGQAGLDIGRLYDAGVRMFVFGDGYTTYNDWNVLEKARASFPDDIMLFPELYHVASHIGLDTKGFRLTTREQLHTSAYLAYKRGATGVAVFNFPFYRETGEHEPPFDIFPELKDRTFLSEAPQHYFIGQTMNMSPHQNELKFRIFKNGQSVPYRLDIAAPVGGWSTDGILRLESLSDIEGNSYLVSLNGTVLTEISVSAEPYPTDYTVALGAPEGRKCFAVPRTILREGTNDLLITQTGGADTSLIFIDMAIR